MEAEGAAAQERLPGTLQVGDVISTTAKIIGANLVPLLIIAFLFELPEFVINLGVGLFTASAQENPSLTHLIVAGVAGVISFIIQMTLTAMAQGAITYVSVEHLADQPVGLGPALKKGLARLAPLIGASLLVGLIVGVGIIFCVVPGVLASLMFAVTIPAVVMEKAGVLDAMRRSSKLTEGNRLPIFLCYLVLAAPLLVAVCLITTVSGAMSAALTATDAVYMRAIFNAVFGLIMGIPFLVLYAVVPAVFYTRLRGSRDGVDVQALAEVFA